MSMLIMKLELKFILTEKASLPMFYSTSIRKLAVKKLYASETRLWQHTSVK